MSPYDGLPPKPNSAPTTTRPERCVRLGEMDYGISRTASYVISSARPFTWTARHHGSKVIQTHRPEPHEGANRIDLSPSHANTVCFTCTVVLPDYILCQSPANCNMHGGRTTERRNQTGVLGMITTRATRRSAQGVARVGLLALYFAHLNR